MSPNDSIATPARDINTASNTHFELFTPKNRAMIDVTAYITLRAAVRNNIPAGCRSVLPNMNLAARPMMTAAKTIL